MSVSSAPLILASASPRRREILATLQIPCMVEPSGLDESSLDVGEDFDFVRQAATMKLQEVLRRPRAHGAFVLAADTIVCAGGERLGKPEDDDAGLAMLQLLAGGEHRVMTAVALGSTTDGLLEDRVVETRVTFREASEEELRSYVASGEGRDKAGGYGIQGLASGFVTRLEGSYTNVVGLPAAEVVSLLSKHGALTTWP